MRGEARGCAVRLGLWHKVYVFNVRDVFSHVLELSRQQLSDRPGRLRRFSPCAWVFTPIDGERAANIVLRLRELPALASNLKFHRDLHF